MGDIKSQKRNFYTSGFTIPEREIRNGLSNLRTTAFGSPKTFDGPNSPF
jgi:hypothetical protein